MHDADGGGRDNDVAAVLAEQRRHQTRIDRQRMTWWIPLLFAAGLIVATLGLIAAIAESRARGSASTSLFVFGLFVLLFGWGVLRWALGPLLHRPRLVPYFTRELGRYGGDTIVAFKRGRGLYLEIAALDEAARQLGVQPLSSFGFGYDHYGQEVRWHSADVGLATVDALRQQGDARLLAAPDVANDLDALSSVLREAAAQGVDFSVVLRLFRTESMQAVSTREERQGSFW